MAGFGNWTQSNGMSSIGLGNRIQSNKGHVMWSDCRFGLLVNLRAKQAHQKQLEDMAFLPFSSNHWNGHQSDTRYTFSSKHYKANNPHRIWSNCSGISAVSHKTTVRLSNFFLRGLNIIPLLNSVELIEFNWDSVRFGPFPYSGLKPFKPPQSQASTFFFQYKKVQRKHLLRFWKTFTVNTVSIFSYSTLHYYFKRNRITRKEVS